MPHKWLLMFLLTSLILLAGGRLAPRDEETAYRMTANLIERGQLTITQQSFTVAPQPFPAFLPHQVPRVQDTTWSGLALDGQRYPLYSHAQPLLQIPLYAIGRMIGGAPLDLASVLLSRFTVSMLNPIVIALTGWLIALFAARLNYSTRLSISLALAYCFATMALAYSHTNFSDPLLALLFTLAAYGAYRARDDDQMRWIALTSLAIALAIYLRERSLILLPIFMAYLIFTRRLRSITHWIVLLCPIVCAALLIAGWNWLRFGSPLAFGYATWVEDTGFSTPIVLGVYGLLISPGKGLLIYNPIVVPGFLGLIPLLRRRRAEAITFIFTVVVSIVFYASYNFWTGGWNWGPRYMLPLLPFLLLAAGEWVSANPSRFRRGLLIVLGAITFSINLPALLVDQSRYLVALSERDPDHYLARSILQIQDSPVLQQWPTVLETIGLYLQPDSWSAARRAIDDHLRSYTGPNDVESLSTHAMWADEFFRLNLPDFWWLHLSLLGYSPILINLSVVVLLIGVIISGRKLVRSIKHG